MSLRDTYGLPRSGSAAAPVWMWGVMLAVPAAALVLWLVFPDSAITVVLLAIAVIAAVGTGVFLVLAGSKDLQRPPRDSTRA